MTKLNPYAAAIRTAHVVGYTLISLFFLAAFVAIVVAAAFNWGWWAFLWFPLTVIGVCLALLAVGGVGYFLTEVIPTWFRRKRREWDRKHRD